MVRILVLVALLAVASCSKPVLVDQEFLLAILDTLDHNELPLTLGEWQQQVRQRISH